MDLLTATIEGVLLGQPVDRESWLHLRRQLRWLNNERTAEEGAMLTLARIATFEDTSSLDTLLNTIPAANKPLRAIGEVLAASRSVDTTDARSLGKLVYASVQVLPYVEKRVHIQPALERLADLQAHAIEISGDRLDPIAATSFTYLANTLSLAMGNHGYLDAAFAMADQLRPFPAEELQPKKSAHHATTSNLVTTCKQLAKHRPSDAERYLIRGVELASYLYESRREMLQSLSDPQSGWYMVVQVLKNLMFMHVELARVSPARSAQYAAAAWADVSYLRQLAEERQDLDLGREVEKAEDFLRERVGVLPSSQVAAEKPALGSADDLILRINTTCQASSAAAQHLRQLAAGPERDHAITEHLDGLYGVLARRLAAAIREVGINRHISQVFLGLGALASGRLWPLAMSAIGRVLTSPPPERGASHRHQIELDQELPPRGFFNPESSYVEHVCALATFSDALSSEEDLAEMVMALLRERNRELLQRVLSAVQPRHVPNRKLSKIDDLVEIMTLAQEFGGRQEPAPAAPFVPQAERAQECSCDSGKPFRQCHGGEESPADAAPPRTSGASPANTDLSSNAGWVSDPGPDGSSRTIVDAEDMLGQTGRLNGEPYIFDSILGMGRHKVVFGLRSLATGKGVALLMPQSSFGPMAKLQKYLESIGPDQQAYDPNEMLALCDAVLARDRLDRTAGFNKATALIAKEDFAAAIEAFDLVLVGDSDNLYALVYKAYALSELARHSVAVIHLARVAALHPDGLREVLRTRHGVKDKLSASVLEVLRADPDRVDARQLSGVLS